MGNCVSNPEQADAVISKQRSEDIDRQIQEDSRKFRKECKILLLGPGESGKSTIVKQMKILHQNGFSKEELMAYRSVIFRNVVDSAQTIVHAMQKLKLDCELPENRVPIFSMSRNDQTD
ncbi:G-alpha-domain-containing protein [Leucogyrophana mollusca]|uniref:G-alpha-domain-containing protein n=1 Tax=Leucogyrophana mollusca TaxID=85980 RepID=A0ACB8B432_9AGAM|nr:G-alpha-domain-containing protein [Leucogyrophana mollusca]